MTKKAINEPPIKYKLSIFGFVGVVIILSFPSFKISIGGK